MRSSKLDFINSRMSLGARLATLSLIFCVPIVLLGFLFVTQSLKDIRATKQESAGSEYLANIWPTFEAAATDSKAGDTGSLETGRAKFDPAFGTAAASGAFVSATDSAAKLVAGNALMSAIADGSGLTLDPELDSFYVMSPVAFDIPALLLANTEVDVAAALPAQDPSRVPKLAEAFQSLQIASKNVSDHIQAGIKANAAGETKSALEDPNKKLKAAADAVLGH